MRVRARCRNLTGVWDVLEWHNGTLSFAWWAVLLLAFVLLGLASKSHRK